MSESKPDKIVVDIPPLGIIVSKLRTQWPFVSIVAGVVCAFALVFLSRWRRAAVLLALVAIWACLLRVVLDDTQAGWLVNRRKTFDAALWGVLGVLTLIVALSIDGLGTGSD